MCFRVLSVATSPVVVRSLCHRCHWSSPRRHRVVSHVNFTANHNSHRLSPQTHRTGIPLVDSIAAQSLFIPLHPLHLHPLNSYTLSPLTTLSHQSSPFCTLLSLVMHLTHSNITPNSLCTSYGIHIGCFGHNRT